MPREAGATEVAIEKRGNTVILRPTLKPKLKTLADVARDMREHYPQGRDFPDIERSREQPPSFADAGR